LLIFASIVDSKLDILLNLELQKGLIASVLSWGHHVVVEYPKLMMTRSKGLELNSVEVGGWIRILYFLKNLSNLDHNSILKYFQ
jgi:hypothetical protein